MLDLLNDHSSIRDVEDVVNAYFLGADRERCGEALVSTGYITNQQNLTGGDDVIRWAYQAFNPALIQALVDRSEENQ